MCNRERERERERLVKTMLLIVRMSICGVERCQDRRCRWRRRRRRRLQEGNVFEIKLPVRLALECKEILLVCT